MSAHSFSTLPSINISRSKIHKPITHKTSIKLGEITPILLEEVLPGSTININMASLIRNLSLIAPVMDNISMDIYSFFVPNRLCWSHWKEFMGENTTGAGIYSGTAYTIPTFNLFTTSGAGIPTGCLGDHFGLPLLSAGSGKTLKVSVLPVRAYRLIYNRWFRDQNLIAPVTVNIGDSANSNDRYDVALFKAAKYSDYFTRALPYAQKGAAVTIPLGTTAPVIVGGDGGTIPYSGSANQNALTGTIWGSTGSTNIVVKDASSVSHAVYADLSSATASTINQLRFAFQYQKLLERDALYGSRYWEILKGHFGVDAPDASLQDPEFLGHIKTRINVDQVVQTTGGDQSTPSQNELGAVGAYSVTGDKGNIVTKSFTEHGMIMILAVARHDQTYGQGVSRMWTRSERTDFYFPEFANLGAQKVLNKEIYADGSVNDDATFGFQEAWAEYRQGVNLVTGILRPNASQNLGFYTLANNFASRPTLSQSFIEQDVNALDRASSVSGQPHFICDFYFDCIEVLPMPVYSIPGLIDHH